MPGPRGASRRWCLLKAFSRKAPVRPLLSSSAWREANEPASNLERGGLRCGRGFKGTLSLPGRCRVGQGFRFPFACSELWFWRRGLGGSSHPRNRDLTVGCPWHAQRGGQSGGLLTRLSGLSDSWPRNKSKIVPFPSGFG
ncbi:60S ribosomal protein L39 isoform X1 [Macaca thibetana thibetana]|uniref:60S ribosomal protein L39 isoform X1 n=1 Tax=Macaca thibetana thibetana TaxID=257877 RepID=UPI0021BC88BC|nr:60S ribosomal protein L39 isoform X1 [Macaca thibetana thibetana]